MWSSSSTSQNEQKPTARRLASRARKQYAAAEFSSSARYIDRVHGLVNDACSMARTSSMSSRVSGSITSAAMALQRSCRVAGLTQFFISRDFDVGASHVQRRRADGSMASAARSPASRPMAPASNGDATTRLPDDWRAISSAYNTAPVSDEECRDAVASARHRASVDAALPTLGPSSSMSEPG
jgi:hypothetical protein